MLVDCDSLKIRVVNDGVDSLESEDKVFLFSNQLLDCLVVVEGGDFEIILALSADRDIFWVGPLAFTCDELLQLDDACISFRVQTHLRQRVEAISAHCEDGDQQLHYRRHRQ